VRHNFDLLSSRGESFSRLVKLKRKSLHKSYAHLNKTADENNKTLT